MMFEMNNKQVLRKVTKRSVSTNRARNIFAVSAIFLTTVMIFAVCSIGVNFMKNYKVMQIRMSGTEAEAFLYGASEEQYEQIQQLDKVSAVGKELLLNEEVVQGISGDEFGVQHWYYDKTDWEEHVSPALSDITGTYPARAEEVMMPVSALKKLGIDVPEIGMRIQMAEEYTLTGWFTQYVEQESVLRSREAVREYPGISMEEHGRMTVSVQSPLRIRAQLEQLELKEGQAWEFRRALAGSESMNIQVILLLCMVCLFLVLSGYLFIYNVMYISVARDTQFYGMLKTLGTTPKQIRRIVRGQAYAFACLGIPAGIAVGSLISFALVPKALNLANGLTAMPKGVSFYPAIFVGTIAFSFLTVLVSCRKPAKTAGKVSPIEAVKYTGVENGGKKKARNTVKGGRTGRMALHNVFRYKKRAMLVFSSLFVGTITILCVNGILGSMSVERYLERYFPNDMRVENVTVEDGAANQKLLEDIVELDGVKDVEYTWSAQAVLQYDGRVYGQFVDEAIQISAMDLDEAAIEELRSAYEAGQERYTTTFVSIDSATVKEYSKNKGLAIDIADFEAGKTALIGYGDWIENPELLTGEKIVSERKDGSVRELEIAAAIDSFDFHYQSTVSSVGAPSVIYVSDKAILDLTDDTQISELQFNMEGDRKEQLNEEVIRMLESASVPIVYHSVLEWEQLFRSDMQMMTVIGNSMSALLILTGMLNFVNVMLTGVYTRRRELAVMESVGMTKRQIRKMLTFEGAAYAIISIGLILTVGSAVLALVAKWVPSLADYAQFKYPTGLVCFLIILIIAICLSVPGIVYKLAVKEPVTERLRETG